MSMSDVAAVPKPGVGERAKKMPTRKLPHFLVRQVGPFDPEVKGQLFEFG